MKQISTNLLAVLCVMLLLFTACKKNSDFTVEGVVSGADGQMMYLENVGVSTVELMDSVKLTAAGKFSFTKPRPAFPDFYRLRLNNQLINFSVDSTETISFVADAGTFATSYSVEGSENCKAIKNITLAQLDANQAIHRLRKESESGLLADSVYSRQVLEAAEAYKDVARKYIYSAPMSAAAYFALFQQIDGLLFFDLYDKNDSKAYGAVATSFDHYYPESPRAKHLYNLALQSIKVIRSQRPMDLDKVEKKEVSFLDIELPDVHGENTKLSSVATGENEYRIRSVAKKGSYLYSFNDQLSWSGSKEKAMRFTITTGDPTANESIADAAEGVKVIAGNGTVEIQGAAGKNVVITNVLGKVVASTVLTSDDATIAAPAGIVVVSVEGEEAVKAVVK